MSGKLHGRRDFLALASAAALAATPLASEARRRSSDADVSKLYDAAKKEGTVVWWQSPYPLSVCEQIRDAFKKRYPGVEVQMLKLTAQQVYLRAQQGIKSGIHECDVIATSDEAHFTSFKKSNALAEHVPPDIDKLLPQFRQLDPDETYQTGGLAFVVLNYNPKKMSLPRRWPDLLDAKAKGQVSLGHPGFSGFVALWAMMVQDKYGWDYFTKLNALQPKIGRSIYDTVSDLVSGERTLSAGVDALAYEKKAGGAAIDVHFPDDDATIIVSPVAVFKDAPHPNAARLFANFYYSREFSKEIARTYNLPLRGDVPSIAGLRLEKIKYQRIKLDRQIDGVPEVIRKWRTTFGV